VGDDLEKAGAVVVLEPLPEAHYEAWAEGVSGRLAEQRVKGGTHDRPEAHATASDIVGSRMPGGRSTPGQHVFRVVADGVPVGQVWLSVGPDGDGFIYDVDPPSRVAAILSAVEDAARDHGARVTLYSLHLVSLA